MTAHHPSALVVYESMFDNTAQTAVGAPAERAGIGLREWVARAIPGRFGTDRVVVFDTRIGLVRRPVGFTVTQMQGAMRPGELARAERWGR